MCDFARARERVNKLRARTLAVRDEARDAASVYAAPGDGEVVARAPRDAAKLKLALRRRVRLARVCARERETGVALYALARGEERVALRFAEPAFAARLKQ